MAQYSAKERLIASMLSAFPGVKRKIKTLYSYIGYCLNKKKYKDLVNSEVVIDGIENICTEGRESFFGYYDKCPDNGKGIIAYHRTLWETKNKPNAEKNVEIVVRLTDGTELKAGESCSYTWQQGARTQWLNDDLLAYNVFEDGRYKSHVFSVEQKRIVKTFNYPVQDSLGTDYFLSINHRRLMSVSPDYGYRNLPLYSTQELADLEHDGIWKVDFESGKGEMLVTLKDVVACEHEMLFDESVHTVNHVMINRAGDRFIFIHRFYQGKRKADRLLLFDRTQLKVLANEKMVSHCCWFDNDTVFGYLRYGGKDGFFFIDVNTGKVSSCNELTQLGNGDGHPTCFGKKIVVDTYPDKSRMQHLMLLDMENNNVVELLEVFHGLKYMYETRCDMHPRFASDGKSVYFDSVYMGKRTLCKVCLKDNN